ncbi:uncharacterized protein BX664DRAFT_258964 [Halteromyces radiatus]|uniref:uncharacterized protein n=1 Tax=Halteromyces radiatus TaxID=101107 RepID=UPI00221EF553|nr:uncharacterized protein BX664DRAFT_258964 [Halteromyces radiatus]KAI8096782.1 hypothetical protein BX664DRAFT_258964 [Halteromyces radiatus]
MSNPSVPSGHEPLLEYQEPDKNIKVHQVEGAVTNHYDDDDATRLAKQQQQKATNKAAVFRQIRMFAMMIIIDIGLPLALYFILEMYTSQLIALIVSGIPPLLHVLVTFIIKRRIEVLGCICVFSFILSAILSLISGDARLALLRDSSTSAVIGTAFLITLIPIHTKWFTIYPLTFLIAQQMLSELPPKTWMDQYGVRHSLPVPEFFWTYYRGFRLHSRFCTAMWGVVLLTEFTIKVIMIEATSLSVDQIVLYGTIINVSILVSCATFSVISTIFIRRKCATFITEWLKVNDYTNHHTATDENV